MNTDTTIRFPRHTTGRADGVLITMAVHHANFEVQYFEGKIMVDIGGVGCGMHLSIEQAEGLRDLLDAGITDARTAAALACARVDLVKVVA